MHELYLFDGAVASQGDHGDHGDLDIELSELDDYVVLSPEMLELVRAALADMGNEPEGTIH